ncbi:MAG: DUF5784 family protein, partial [Haloarculaceae archaeon]
MAGPLRFRRSPESWHLDRVRGRLLSPLDDRFGARLATPWFAPPRGYEARRLEMDNGDVALFCWPTGGANGGDNADADGDGDGDGGGTFAYWVGNTETPESLWRTEKVSFGDAPYPVARWAQRELLARLETVDPWLADFEHVAWFFLPVLLSKDGRGTTRRFLASGAGFPDADPEAALAFFEDALATGMLDDHRYTMAAKLGTSEGYDDGRMAATMAEFTVAKLLDDAGLAFDPEVELDSGHALDFRVHADADAADDGGAGTLVEVTRPRPPARRDRADTPAQAVRETAGAKRDGQLRAHPEAV